MLRAMAEDPAIRLMRLAVGGATRPDSFTGMDARFSSALDKMIGAAPPKIAEQLKIGSGYRSVERQQQLWDQSDKTGKMVARPGHSQHNFGRAADLKYLGGDAKAWVHDNASQYGLAFPMNYEPWHIELAGARGMSGNHSASASPPNVMQNGAPDLIGPPTSAGSGAPTNFQYQPSWIENDDFSPKSLLDDIFGGRNPLKRLAYSGLMRAFG